MVIEVEREKHQTKLKKPDEPQGRPNSSSSNFGECHHSIDVKNNNMMWILFSGEESFKPLNF